MPSCDECGEEYHIDDMHHVGIVYYCGNCFDELFENCEACGRTVEREHASYDHGGYPFCSDCIRDDPDRFFESEDDVATKNELMVKDAFGVEIESYCDNNDYLHEHKETRFFSAVDDGSLDQFGVEYVSVPMFFNKESYKIIHNFTKALREQHEIDTKCGCHIHINLLPYISTEHASINQITVAMKKLIVGYKNIEDYFYSLMPQSRQNNFYCRRLDDLKTTGLIKNRGCKFLSYFYNERIKSVDWVPKDKYPNNGHKRYYWVNGHALFYKNTLEIRLFNGTLSSRKIIMWANINRKIVRYLMTHTIRDAMKFGKDKMLELLDEKERRFLMVREKAKGVSRPVEEILGDFFV